MPKFVNGWLSGKLPALGFRARGLLVFLSGITLFYVLYIFRGYGIQSGISLSGHSLLQRSLGFGLLNFSLIGILEFGVFRFYRWKNTAGIFIWILLELWLGATAVFLLFNYFWSGTEWNPEAYLLILKEYPLVMLFPILLAYGYQILSAKRASSSPAWLTFTSENGKEVIRLLAEDLLFVESDGNYVQIHYQRNGTKTRQLLRNRLKDIESQAGNTKNLIRCHRSFLVNPVHIRQIVRTKGRIQLDLGEVQLPVSSSYEHRFI